MELNRREFLKRFSYTGISLLVFNGISIAEETTKQEETKLILPTLEEITKNLSKTHEEVLETAIKEGLIKKFEYKRQTTVKDLYGFLNEWFKNEIVFTYFSVDDNTSKKNIWGSGGGDERLSSGSATIFYYTMLNLKKSNSDVGFLFLELVDFHGEENWEELKRMFDNKLKGFPSYVEFKRTNSGTYVFNHISGSSQRDPQTILKWIGEYVEDFRKRLPSK